MNVSYFFLLFFVSVNFLSQVVIIDESLRTELIPRNFEESGTELAKDCTGDFHIQLIIVASLGIEIHWDFYSYSIWSSLDS